MSAPTAEKPVPLAVLWRALRALRAAFSVAVYMLVAPSGLLPYALFCLFWRGTPRERARVLQRISCRGVRIMHGWLRLFRIVHFDRRAAHLALPGGACVVVSNHPTQLDPTVLMSLLVEACTLVKPSVYNRRFVHHLLAGAWHFEGPSQDPASLAQVVADATERLRAGMHLFVFPEGTRSPQGRLHEFRRIAFEIACRADVPLVSIALRCSPCYLSRETPLLWPPARLPVMEVAQLAVDLPADCGRDSRALKQRVEQRYRDWVAAGMPSLLAARGDDRPTIAAPS